MLCFFSRYLPIGQGLVYCNSIWNDSGSCQIARHGCRHVTQNRFEITESIDDEHASFLSSVDLLCSMRDALEVPQISDCRAAFNIGHDGAGTCLRVKRWKWCATKMEEVHCPLPEACSSLPLVVLSP